MSRIIRPTGSIQGLAALAGFLLLAPAVAAQSLASADIGSEIVRDADTLRDELRPRPVDEPDVADTALIFTNLSGNAARVLCVAFDRNGEPVGRRWLSVPKLGLRFVLASDFSDGRDFVGHAQCSVPARMKGSAIFLGPDITNLNVIQPWRAGRIRFPVVATY
jgi:hypothetical protein